MFGRSCFSFWDILRDFKMQNEKSMDSTRLYTSLLIGDHELSMLIPEEASNKFGAAYDENTEGARERVKNLGNGAKGSLQLYKTY
jgi:hypothetical protein